MSSRPNENGEFSFTCTSCRTRSILPASLAGKPGNCPVCDLRVTFPAAVRPEAGKSDELISFLCEHCGTRLGAPRSKTGGLLPCARCQKKTRVSPQPEAVPDELALAEPEEAPKRVKPVNKKAFLAWEEMEKQKEDTFPKALLRALLYPVGEIGVIGFFVIGIPLALSLIRFLGDWAIATCGGDGNNLLVSAVVVAELVALAALTGVLASFLFAITRVTVTGGNTAPVIQGLHHRANLESLAGWTALYFTPALFLSLQNVTSTSFFTFTFGTGIAVLLLSPFAPVSFLFLAVQGGDRLFDLKNQMTLIKKTLPSYLLLLAMMAASSTLFLLGGYWLNQRASLALSGESPSYLMGTLLRFSAGCLTLFPLVTATRMIGLYGRYYKKLIPGKILDTEPRMTFLPAKCALVFGLLLLFLPLNQYSQLTAAREDVVESCRLNLDAIRQSCRAGDRYRWPVNNEEFILRFSASARCPCRPSIHSSGTDYEVAVLPPNSPNELMLLYDREGNHPDGSRCVIFQGGDVRKFSSEKFESLMKLQLQIIKYPTDEMRIREMRTLRIF